MLFTYKGLEYKLILLNLAGSRFYNTNFEKGDNHPYDPNYVSDYDYKGVYIVNNQDALGMFAGDFQEEIQPKKIKDQPFKDELINTLNENLDIENIDLDADIALYSLKKFLKMSADNNPNILDILFTDEESIFYSTPEWDILQSMKNTFLTTKVQKTFSEYGKSQMFKMKSHYKMINNFPLVNELTEIIRTAFLNKDINFQWINDNFSGDLTKFIVHKELKVDFIEQDIELDKDSKEYKALFEEKKKELEPYKVKSLTWNEFVLKYIPEDFEDIYKYRKPFLIDFMTFKDIKGAKHEKDITISQLLVSLNEKNIIDTSSYILSEEELNTSLYDFLLNKASFRTLGESVINIFTKPTENYNGGVLGKDGNLKANDPKEVGDFLGSVLINKLLYKSTTDYVKKLWYWKSQRNENRSVLEEKFGYDTKNSGHLIRLLSVAIKIFETNTYEPRLNKEDSMEIKSIINGKYTYDEIIELSEKLENDLNNIMKKSSLPEKVDNKTVNKVLIDIMFP